MPVERAQYRDLSLLLFPPSELSLYAQSAGGADAVPQTSGEALRSSGGEAVLNGPMFEKCDPSAPYASQSCGHVLYKHIDLATGVRYDTQRSTWGMTISVLPDGSTVAASGSTAAPGARVSVQLYPSLVIQGEPSGVANQGAFSYVAALAIMSDGRMAFVVGRNLSLPSFAQQLADAGAVYAGYTDGGGSAALETLNGYIGSSEHRRVLTWLVARPAGGVGSTSSTLAKAGLALLVLGAGWWWYKREMHARSNPGDRDCGGWSPIDPMGWSQCDPRTIPRAARHWPEARKALARSNPHGLPVRHVSRSGHTKEAIAETGAYRYRGLYTYGALGSRFTVSRTERNGDVAQQQWSWELKSPNQRTQRIGVVDMFGKQLDLPDYLVAQVLLDELRG